MNKATLIHAINCYLQEQKNVNLLGNLYSRWQSEKEYEDFEDYIKVMKDSFVFPDLIVRGTKKPFGFVLKCMDRFISIHLKRKGSYMVLCATYVKR